MISIDETTNGQRAIARRELLRIGGISTLGLSLPQLLASRARAATESAQGPLFGQAKNIIWLYMSGGPSQYETFDPKPDAPAEIRGIFNPIATNVPGINICELLPRVARIADKLAIVRSMATDDPNHESGGYWVNTGHKYVGPNMRSVNPDDWPTLGSIVKMLKPSTTLPFTSVMLPEPLVANPNVFLPGQNGGFMGARWDPEIFNCDPADPAFRIDDFSSLADVPALRLNARRNLLQQVDQSARYLQTAGIQERDRLTQEAMGLLLSGTARGAFALDQESAKTRDRYGRGKWGQSVLLGRRLIEAGVRMAFVNWPREPGDLSAGNPLWDTHSQNNPRMKDVLCPQFDLGFTALIEDLDERGLLDETLVVAIGEMGRTPRFNGSGGRDHWGNVFSFVLAGAGISGAQVHGASDKTGAFPVSGRVQPQDLTATILHLLGIGSEAFFPDRFGRPIRATEGEPLEMLFGTQPATSLRTTPGGLVPQVVKTSNELLVNGDFEESTPLASIEKPVRGWQAYPTFDPNRSDEFTVLRGRVPGPRSRSGEHHVGIGYGLWTGEGKGQIPQGARAMLVQQIYNPRPGKFNFSIFSSGGSMDRPDYYRDVWEQHFTCRLVIFGYADAQQNPLRITEFASQKFTPAFAGPYEANYRQFSVTTRLESQNGGANQLQHGVGVAVIVEKTSPGMLDVPSGGPRSQGLIRIEDVRLDFTA